MSKKMKRKKEQMRRGMRNRKQLKFAPMKMETPESIANRTDKRFLVNISGLFHDLQMAAFDQASRVIFLQTMHLIVAAVLVLYALFKGTFLVAGLAFVWVVLGRYLLNKFGGLWLVKYTYTYREHSKFEKHEFIVRQFLKLSSDEQERAIQYLHSCRDAITKSGKTLARKISNLAQVHLTFVRSDPELAKSHLCWIVDIFLRDAPLKRGVFLFLNQNRRIISQLDIYSFAKADAV